MTLHFTKTLSFIFLLLLAGNFSYAQSDIEDIQEGIQTSAQAISKLESDIQADQRKLEELEGEKNTLNKAIVNLRYSENKLKKDIYTTSGKIEETEKQLETLGEQIIRLEGEIDDNKEYVKNTLSSIREQDNVGFWEKILIHPTLSAFVEVTNQFTRASVILKNHLVELKNTKQALAQTTEEQKIKKEDLEEFVEELDDKKKVVAYTKSQKSQLLSVTKNEEKNYQASLSEKLELKRQFEQTLLELESQLQIFIDKTKYAGTNPGLFSWPVSGFRVTQFFGNTDFAVSGAYNGRGHSGVDFAIPTGTPVRAVMDGTVLGAFNTDSVGARGSDGVYRKCVSYGGWVLIRHDNGLATLVAHNSLLKVKKGQRVQRGDIVAYSGNTGYSTGPHLHFSTYAAEGVSVKRLGDVSSSSFYCKNAIIPIIALNAYLDPYAYLPRPYFKLAEATYGQNNSSIRNLQMALKHERIFPVEVGASGKFGPTTEKALSEWKQKYGLGRDGKKFTASDLRFYEKLFE